MTISAPQKPLEFRPETLLIPVLKDTAAGSFGIETIAQILRHHCIERRDVTIRDRLAQSADERLEIHVTRFFLRFLRSFLGRLGRLFLFVKFAGRFATSQSNGARQQQESENS